MSFKSTVISIFVVFVVALLLSEGEPKPYAHWSYTEDEGPKEWATLDDRFNMCEEGVNQSPINLELNHAINAQLPELTFVNKGKALTFEDNGHALQVNFSSGNKIKVNEETYSLEGIHFHSPSEHKINGKSFPMEAHLVHKKGANTLVVAVMFEESTYKNKLYERLLSDVDKKANSDNLFINKLLRNIPTKEETKKELKSEIFPYEILPSSKEYYSYNGSLTTPPCTEGVKWVIMKDPILISKSQLKDFTDLINNNIRPLQKINARFILK